jgi:tRNA dimethylallyltransferase
MPTVYFLVGPTAVGKSAVVLHLARRMNAEIISCDSMQVYRGMDILTSKPSAASLDTVTHHLISVIPTFKDFNVTLYRDLALKVVRAIEKKKKVPLFVGGTGIYVSVLLDGIFTVEAYDEELRERLTRQAQDEGNAVLHRRLSEVDPLAALKIHPNDSKRIIRALEVYQVTGRPISELQKERTGLIDTHEVRVAGLRMEMEILRRRIDERVDNMIEAGVVDEARGLLKKKISRTAGCALGIKEIRGYLKGEHDLETAVKKLRHETYQYARRQMTWFRKEKRIVWFDVGPSEKPEKTATRIGELWKKRYS